MEDFEQTVRPTPKGVKDSLAMLRKLKEPFAAKELASRLDLLFLPFLKGIPTVEQRVERLQIALDFVASDLSPEQQIVYRHVFQQPAHSNLGRRQADAAVEISQRRSPGTKVQAPAARKIEEGLLLVLAKTLLDPDFEDQLGEQYPLHRDTATSLWAGLSDAFELVNYKCELTIDDSDLRKQEEHRTAKLRLLLPHQRVIGFRYYNQCSPPIPEKDGVTMLSDGHTYLGTLSETLAGSPADYWWMHFIHLGERKEPGDEVVIETQERYFDEGEHDNHPHITVLVRFESLRTVELAVRLPKGRRAEAKPFARVVKDPYDANLPVDKWPLTLSNDGWVRETFTNCKVGVQYGIFFPGFDLYKK